MATRTTVQISLPADGGIGDRGHGPRVAASRSATASRPTSRSSRSRPTRSTPRCPPRPPGTLTEDHRRAGQTVAVGAVLGEIEVRAATAPAPAAAATAPTAERRELVDVALPEMGDRYRGHRARVAGGGRRPRRSRRPLVEISTDKVDAELPSPVAGTIAEILVEPDDTVAGRRPCYAASRPAPAPPRRSPQPSRPRPTPAADPPPATATRTRRRSPRAWPPRTGSTSTSVNGSGPRGRVTKEDVLAALATATAPRRARPKRRRGHAAPRARRHARALHGREPLDPDRDQLPHARGRHARRTPRASSRPAGKQVSLHAPDRLGDRPGRAASMPVMGHSFAERDGKPYRVVPGDDQPRPGGRRPAQGRHALAGRAGASRTRAS